MKMNPTHKSRLHRGFEKQVARQNLKPSAVKIKLPAAVKLPANFKGKYKHCIIVSNNKWNGMNLKNLCNSFGQSQPDWMYSKRSINKDGKYVLSFHGKQVLRKKKAKKENHV